MNDELKDKIILLVVEAIVVGGIIFFFSAQYKSLMSLDDIKFVKEEVSCLTDICDKFRQKVYLYRMGEKKLQNIDLHVQINESSLSILEGSQTVTQRERGFWGGTTSPSDGGRIFPEPEMVELTNKNYYGFRVNELDQGWKYELMFDVESKIGRPLQKYANFEINNGSGVKYERQGLGIYDYLRLYLIEAVVVAIFSTLVIALVIWFSGKYLLARRNSGGDMV